MFICTRDFFIIKKGDMEVAEKKKQNSSWSAFLLQLFTPCIVHSQIHSGEWGRNRRPFPVKYKFKNLKMKNEKMKK